MGSLEKTVKDIKSMKIRSAREIATVALRTIRKITKKKRFGKEFKRACKLLVKARPTAVVLHNVIKTIEKEKSIETMDKLLYYLENIGNLIGFLNYKIIKNNSTILTHCHSRDVVDFLKITKEKGRKFNVIATETRPLYQGLITAKELSAARIPVTYIIDSAAGFFVKDINAMIFGCDAIRKEGIVNKIGTYPLAVLAKDNKIPVYFVGGTIKLDRRKKIIIEERSSEEIISRKKLRGTKICNPAFDITPWKYISAVITEKGILKSVQVKRMLK